MGIPYCSELVVNNEQFWWCFHDGVITVHSKGGRHKTAHVGEGLILLEDVARAAAQELQQEAEYLGGHNVTVLHVGKGKVVTVRCGQEDVWEPSKHELDEIARLFSEAINAVSPKEEVSVVAVPWWTKPTIE